MFRKYHKRYLQNVIHLSGFAANFSIFVKDFLQKKSRDGSSRFASGNKFANFASGAMAWVISEEEFIKRLNIFSNLKVRFSYGQTGNQAISSYQTMSSLTTANYPLDGTLSSGFAGFTAFCALFAWFL